MPVFGTMASRFNDDGVTALYQALAGPALGLDRCRGPPAAVSTRHSTHQTPIVPGARVRYLAEIADTVRGYKAPAPSEPRSLAARDPAAAPSARACCTRTTRAATGRGPPCAAGRSAQRTRSTRRGLLLAMWPDMQRAYAGDEYVVKIRDKEIRTGLSSTPRCRATRSARSRCRSTRTTANC